MSVTLTSANVRSACVCLNLQRAARAVARRYDRALQRVDLTSGQFSILAGLLCDEPVSLGDLAAALGLERTTLNRNLRPLEHDGLVETVPDSADRRVRALRLTARGRARVAEAAPLWRAAQSDSERTMGKAAWPAFKRILETLA